MKIGIQGGPGSYHDIVTRKFLGSEHEIVGAETFPKLFASLDIGELDSVVAAQANNRKGPISETNTALLTGQYAVVGEVYLRVQHQLLGIPGTTLDNVQEIHTQDHAMEQCGTFLHGGELHKGVRRIEQDDTAESARLVAQWQDPTKAAIASSAAGELHGLEVIRSNVQDDPDNITRFLHLERLNGQRPEPTDNKSSVLVRTKHLPGALVDVLLPFKEEDINVSNLHLGYVPNSPFDMRFLLEFDAGLLDARAKRALAVAGACALELAVLGSYRSAEIPHSSNGHKSK